MRDEYLNTSGKCLQSASLRMEGAYASIRSAWLTAEGIDLSYAWQYLGSVITLPQEFLPWQAYR